MKCQLCGKDYPRTKEYFNKAYSSKDGMNKECKRCQSITNAKYRNRYKKRFNVFALISDREFEFNMNNYIGY